MESCRNVEFNGLSATNKKLSKIHSLKVFPSHTDY